MKKQKVNLYKNYISYSDILVIFKCLRDSDDKITPLQEDILLGLIRIKSKYGKLNLKENVGVSK